MNQNTLISTALLCSMWDKHNKDTLDLMIPFLKYSIAKKSMIGKTIDVNAVTDHFKSEFGYDFVPQNVIIAMLNRLSPEILKKSNGKYTLCVSLDKEIADFEGKRTLYKERRNKVGMALATFLNEHLAKLKNVYTSEGALSVLIGFFANNGLILVQNPNQLSITKNTLEDRVSYCVARFIVEEYRKETEIFDYIVNMVKGFFVSTAISFHPENLSMPHSKFKNLRCYLDTRVIIDALGLRLPSGKKAALELIDMLRSEQATVCCFQHTVTEISDIINAYKNSLTSPNSIGSYNTLEHWDEENYSVERVCRYLVLLEKKIEDLNIKIVPSPAKFETRVKGLKTLKFQNNLKNKVTYHSSNAYNYDVLSVMGTMRLRNGAVATELEKCDHIFITTNTPLINVLNNCLKDYDGKIPPVISDVSMSSIVWFKCYNSHGDYPKHKLIDNAMLAIEPSSSVLKEFYEEVDHLLAEGELTEDEATIIRTDIHLKRELASSVNGDANLVDKNTVTQIHERLQKRYSTEQKMEAEANYQRYMQQKTQANRALDQVIQGIEDAGEAKKKSVLKYLGIGAWAFFTIIAIVCIEATIAAFVVDRSFGFFAIVLLFLDIFGLSDMLLGKRKIIENWIERRADSAAEIARQKKRMEYSPIIEKLTVEV